MPSSLEIVRKENHRVIEHAEQQELTARMSLMPILGIFSSYLDKISVDTDDRELSTLLFGNSAQEMLGFKEGQARLGFGAKTEVVTIDLEQLSPMQATRILSVGWQKIQSMTPSLIEIGQWEAETLEQITELQKPLSADATPAYQEAWHALEEDLQEKIKQAEQGLRRTQLFPVLYAAPNDGTSNGTREAVQSLNIEGIDLPALAPFVPFNITEIDWSLFLQELPLIKNEHEYWRYPFGTNKMTLLRHLWMLTSLDMNEWMYHNIIKPDWNYGAVDTAADTVLKSKWQAFKGKFNRFEALISDEKVEEWPEEYQSIYLISILVQSLQLGAGIPYYHLEEFVKNVGVVGKEEVLEKKYQTRYVPRLENPLNETGEYTFSADLQAIAEDILQKYHLNEAFLETLVELLDEVDGQSEVSALAILYRKTNQALLSAGVLSEQVYLSVEKDFGLFLEKIEQIQLESKIFISSSSRVSSAHPLVELDTSASTTPIQMGGQEIPVTATYTWSDQTELGLPSSVEFPEEEQLLLPVTHRLQIFGMPDLSIEPKSQHEKDGKKPWLKKIQSFFEGKTAVEAPPLRWEVVIQEALEETFPEAILREAPTL